MPCIYCSSASHKSKNCDVYISKEFRQQVSLEKNCCGFNFKPDSHAIWCRKYNKRDKAFFKCHICFMKYDHFTFDCPDRFTAPHWFLPKIDQALFNRFFKLFDNIELFSFVRKCRDALNYAHLQPFKVMNDYNVEMLEKQQDSVIALVFDTGTAFAHDVQKIFNSKNVFLKHYSLSHFHSECSTEDLFRNFSPFTKKLVLDNFTVTPKVKFYEILVNLPNLTEIELFDTNIEIPNDWPQKILKYSNKKLERIIIHISDYDFSIEDIVKIMTTKSIKNVIIGLSLPYPIEQEKWLNFKEMLLLNHFIQIKKSDSDIPQLVIFSFATDEIIFGYFTLKSYQSQVKEGNSY